MDATTLVQHGIDCLERNDFETARASFRQAALLTSPNTSLIANLGVAEQEEQVEFRRQLFELHANSFECCVALVQSLQAAKYYAQAATVATTAINHFSDEHSALGLRRLRIQSALRAREAGLVKEDFTVLWLAGDNHAGYRRSRKWLLKDMMECTYPAMDAVFDSIADCDWAPQDVAALFRVKAAELRQLGSLKDAE